MHFRPATPDILGPDLVLHINAAIGQAERAEGTAALGEVAEDLCIHYRALAICVFADDGDANEFFHWLLHSPLTYKHYLTTVGAKGLGDPKFLRASFTAPLLDAMAARQWRLAADIARMTSSEWLEGEEYEDDFCYGDFVRRAATGARTGLEELLARWRGVLEGHRDRRLDVAEAFQAKDASAFEDAVKALLQENEAKAREMGDPNTGSVLASDLPYFPNRWVSIEGLALLAAAEREGIATDFDVEGCPPTARASEYAPFYPRGYPNRGLD